MQLLENKVGLITGAGSGIGRETALVFAREGARVVAADWNAESVRETAALVEAEGFEALAVEADVSDEESVAAMVRQAVERFGRLDCASNNAALGAGFHPTTELDRARWDRCIGVTLTGVWLCAKYQIPAMIESGGGAIVNISSQSGIKGQVRQAAYAAAKGGVIALTKTLAAEYARKGIRVNSVAPGGIETPGIASYFADNPDIRETTIAQHALRRLGQPHEIADAVAYLCSDRSSFITGDVVSVDGGVSINAHDA
ncbi:MAG: short-chain dehydrogenase [Deltaproteobacteria bacterium]|jgi:NAD(P)-dependent dehydrogenase (short-subunit alcohol dehydrogenase family)|nr:short-chain dehydrogenase [Deltaproteobacteria bacterium]